ncbi:hypothetical protein BOTBODRAFT_176663 [Botryobasidium botryosum FD-172 SS1]|uniref:3-hydroxyacyl-CoA dehydrogenase n=1 Tax=Botryobasidium botryosum (strain FD-172 SS1) TaxID=930990 RepID=A0A067M982_BOTB1|nr:hypothetical protein BOTBODRAFT_176663 [Botryobasidium botryosum FD-172 SS1]
MPYTVPTTLAGRPFAILGAGTLGRRIALMWLTQGETVHIFDSNPRALQDATTYVSENLETVIRLQVQGGRPGTLKTFVDRTEAVKDAWIVVEAVPEILPLKIQVLGELDKIVRDDCIIATNSSSYVSSDMLANVTKPDRVVSTHYYMPPQSLPVEIMPNKHTNPEIVPLIAREAARHGLQPYQVKKESVGLIFNRIWAAIKREALYVVADGVADPQDVDAMMRDVMGSKLLVFDGIDQVGLDVALAIEEHYAADRPGQIPPQPAALLRKMVEQGKLGKKSGEGFYKYAKPGEPLPPTDRIIFLDIFKGEINSCTTDGKDIKSIISGLKTMPDGVQVDTRPGHGHIYWTNMGSSPKTNDGSIQRSNMDGSNIVTIVPPGATMTPKQLVLDQTSDHLYWCDREGMRVLRCKLDGSNLETLVVAGTTDADRDSGRAQCVGITVDVNRRLLYWTQKGPSKGWDGRILRANIDIPAGQTASNRTDIETLFAGLPEPIDLELHAERQLLYWTDRGDPPFGNTLNRAFVDAPLNPDAKPKGPSKDLIIDEKFHEAIGVTLDIPGDRVYVSDLLGGLYSMRLDGSGKTAVLPDVGNLTGIVFCPAHATV